MVLWRSFVGVSFSCVLLAGCGGNGGGPGPGPNTNATPTSTPTPGTQVEIAVTSSTNTQGYTIVLQRNASATVTQGSYTGTTTVSTADSAQFFSDLQANSPVADVAIDSGCAKSASFGTATTLTYAGSTSGDVSCPPENADGSDTGPADTLYVDAEKIENDVAANLPAFKP